MISAKELRKRSRCSPFISRTHKRSRKLSGSPKHPMTHPLWYDSNFAVNGQDDDHLAYRDASVLYFTSIEALHPRRGARSLEC